MNKSSVETVAFQYREVPPVSEAMGILDMLTGAVSKVLPTLLGGGSGGGSIGNLLSTLLPKLLGMLPQLMGGGGKIDLAGGQPAGDVSQIANLLGGYFSKVGLKRQPHLHQQLLCCLHLLVQLLLLLCHHRHDPLCNERL